ncbi:type II toxin-antitoxin system RelE/ParE family toxin [Pseudarthrobacter sp. CCNWLW207]|uniref:type II toxin-antitoxin system RelE/ParE family toxin n=1 Tax=Pseudarthrobacter sp. CCNWLW207 TaxID=3127468 RepID=UPI0030782E9A
MKQWNYFKLGDARSPVLKEIAKQKLSTTELIKLDELMDRVASGDTLKKDVKPLGDGVMEFVLHLDRRSYRMAYAEVDGGLVLLALTFFRKTKQRQTESVDLAKERLKTYNHHNGN